MNSVEHLDLAIEHITTAKEILQSGKSSNRPIITTENYKPVVESLKTQGIPTDVINLVNPTTEGGIVDYLNNGGEIEIKDPLGGTFTLSGSAAFEVLTEGGFDMSFEDGQLSMGADGTWRPTLSVDADFTHNIGDLASIEGTIDGEIYFEAVGEAQVTVDLNEMKIDAGLGASIEVGANANFNADLTALGGLVDGHVEASAEAKAGLSAGVNATVDLKELKLDAEVNVLASAEAHAEIEADLNVLGSLAGVNIGGQVYAEAYAGINADIVVDPTNGNFYSEGQMGAFAGAGAGGQVGINLFGDAVTMGVQGGVAASAGAGLDYVVGFQEGTFVLDWSVMAGAEAGGYAGTYLEVDVAGVSDYVIGEGVNLVDGAFEMAADTLPGPLGDLAGDVGDFVTDGMQSTGDAIAEAALSGLEQGIGVVGSVVESIFSF